MDQHNVGCESHPCLDVHGGRVVKGTNFVNLRDAGDPVQVAARLRSGRGRRTRLLDITAFHEERNILLDVVRRTADQVFMPLTVGGGIRTIEDIRMLLQADVIKVSINSAACTNPQLVKQAAARFGSQCIVVNIDPSESIEMEKRFGKSTSKVEGSQRGFKQ